MIVVDVNAVAYLWIPGELTELAEQALRKDSGWVTSILWRSEFRNILATYLRRGDLTVQTADSCLAGAEAQLAGHEYLVPSQLVMRQVSRSKCSAYDCEYVALADDLGLQLLTSDGQILRDFSPIAISLKDFTKDIPDK